MPRIRPIYVNNDTLITLVFNYYWLGAGLRRTSLKIFMKTPRIPYVTENTNNSWCPDPVSPGTVYLTAGETNQHHNNNESVSSFLLSATTFPPRFPSSYNYRIRNVNDTEDSSKASSFVSCRRIFGDSWSLSS